MANNRMFLICNVCHPERPAEFTIGREDEGVIHLAKWYPAGGSIVGTDGSYFTYRSNTQLGQDFMQFLFDHQHKDVASQYYTAGAGQENPVRIEYESEDLPIQEGGKDE